MSVIIKSVTSMAHGSPALDIVLVEEIRVVNMSYFGRL